MLGELFAFCGVCQDDGVVVAAKKVDERAEPDGDDTASRQPDSDDTAARQPDGSPDASDDEGGEDRLASGDWRLASGVWRQSSGDDPQQFFKRRQAYTTKDIKEKKKMHDQLAEKDNMIAFSCVKMTRQIVRGEIAKVINTIKVAGDRGVLSLFVRAEEERNMPQAVGKNSSLIAASMGNFDVMKFCLEVGEIDVDDTDLKHSQTHLHYATIAGSKKCVAFLLNLGAVPDIVDIYGRTPLSYALEFKRMDIAMLLRHAAGYELMDMPDVDGMTLTRWAVEPMIRLKDEQNDVFETLALQASSLDCVKWVIRSKGQVDPVDRNGETPLMVAAALGDIQTVKYLVRMNADIKRKSKEGHSAMTFATEKNTELQSVKKRVMVQMIETEYDPVKTMHTCRKSKKHHHASDIQRFFEAVLDKKKKIPWYRKHEKKLIKAIEEDDVEHVRKVLKTEFTCKDEFEKINLLAKAELSMTAVPPNEEPLVAYAVSQHRQDKKTKELIDLLADSNALLDAMDASGSCALAIALECGHHDLVMHLIDKNANPVIMDDFGRSPFLVGCSLGFAVGELDAKTEVGASLVNAMDEAIYKTLNEYDCTKGARVFGAWKRKNIASFAERKFAAEANAKKEAGQKSGGHVSVQDAIDTMQSMDPHGGFWAFMSPFAYDFAGWGPYHWGCYGGEKKLLDWLLDGLVEGKCGGDDDETNPAMRVETGPPFFAAALSSSFSTFHWVESKIHVSAVGLAAMVGVQNFKDLLSFVDHRGCKFRDYLLRTIPELPQLDDIDPEEKDLHATCVAWYRRHVEDFEKRQTLVDIQIEKLAKGAIDNTAGWDYHARRGAKAQMYDQEKEFVVARNNKLADRYQVDGLKADIREGRKANEGGRRSVTKRRSLSFHPGMSISTKTMLKELPKPKKGFSDAILMKQFRTYIMEAHTIERRIEEATRRAEAKYNLGRRWVVDEDGPEEIDLFDLPPP